MPRKRMLPGMEGQVDDDCDLPVLTIISDEDTSQRLMAKYLISCGVRARYDRDFSHRYNNTHSNAIAHSDYQHVFAKIVFLSRVNRGPWGSAANQALKSDMLLDLHKVLEVDQRLQHELRASYLFDQDESLYFSDDVMAEVFCGAKSLHAKTEGAARQQLAQCFSRSV